MVSLSLECQSNLDQIGSKLWHHKDLDLELGDVLQSVSRRKIQLEIHNVLEATANAVRQQPDDVTLP